MSTIRANTATDAAGTGSPSFPNGLSGSITGASTVAAGGSITTTAANDGTKSSGTYTPTPIGGNMKYISNAGAFTLSAPTATGDYTMIIQITNAAGAGVITLSGFTTSGGGVFTTTVGHNFFLYITKLNSFTAATVSALQ